MFLIASLFYEGKQIDLRFKSDRLLAGMFSEAPPPLPSLLYEKSNAEERVNFVAMSQF